MTLTNEEGIVNVRANKNYVYILPSTIADYITRRKPCDLLAVDNFLFRKGYGLAVPKGSALLMFLNKALEDFEGVWRARESVLKVVGSAWTVQVGTYQ